jgi:hypothetical protein
MSPLLGLRLCVSKFESDGVAVKPTGVAWDAVLIREVSQTDGACEARLAEIVGRLREEFDLNE